MTSIDRAPAENESSPVLPFITASEAYPELERQFLAATTEIWAGFRVFDLRTRLRSDEGRAIGTIWLDLIVDRLRAGVEINILVADFDPHLATRLHLGTWRTMRQFSIARELAPDGKLDVRAGLHPARAGFGLRTIFWPFVLKKANSAAREANGRTEAARRWLHEMAAGLRARFHIADDGTLGLTARPIPHIHPATHHQKLAIFDRKTLYIGGLDLDERRYDDPEHGREAKETWQDVSVLAHGECVGAAQTHLESLFGVGPVPKKHTPADPSQPAFIRTLSRDASRNILRLAPKHDIHEIEDAHLELFKAAREVIYIETQYFRSGTIANALVRAARSNPRLTLILMLPAAPDDVAFDGSTGLDARYGEFLQARAIRRVQRAFGDRAFIGMPLRPVAKESDERDTALGADIIYIHSKIAIADAGTGIVSSANLNGRSMRWDTEAGLLLPDAAELRRRLFEHWLPEDAGEEFFALSSCAASWSRLATQNAALPPEQRRGFLAPYDVRPAEKLGAPVPLIPAELV